MRQISRNKAPVVPVEPQAMPTVPNSDVEKALVRAQVPMIYRRTPMAEYPWGPRMKQWLDEVAIPARPGTGLLVNGSQQQVFTVCSILTRALVLKSCDAFLTSLAELMVMEKAEVKMPTNRYIIIAGFYQAEQSPMTPQQAHRLAWWMRRQSGNGSNIIAQIEGLSAASASVWWNKHMLTDLFSGKTPALTIP